MDEEKEITLEIPAVDVEPEDSPTAAIPAEEDGPTVAISAEEDGPTMAIPAEEDGPTVAIPADQPAPEGSAAPAPQFAPPLAGFEPPAEPVRQSFPKVLIPVFLLILVVAAGLGIYLFMNSRGNILLVGIEKTFSQERMINDFRNAMEDGVYTAKYGLEVKAPKGIIFGVPEFTVNAEMTQSMDAEKKEMSLDGKVEFLSFSQSFVACMDDHQILVSLPDLIKTVLKYDYTEDKSKGFLSEAFREGEGPEEWDKFLSEFWDTMDSNQELQQESNGILLQFLEGLEPEKLDKAEFPVDGKNVKCKGYQYTITGDMLIKLWDEYEKLLEKKMKLPEEAKDAMDELDDEVEDALEDMKDITCKVYIWKGRFADIQIESRDFDPIEICFLGGAYPTENMEILMDEGAIEIYGTSEEDKLTRRISLIGSMGKAPSDEDDKEDDGKDEEDEVDLVLLEYTPSSHSLAITIPDELLDELVPSSGMPTGFKASFSLAVEDSADIKKPAEDGKVLNIGTAGEDELEEFVEEVEKYAEKIAEDLFDY